MSDLNFKSFVRVPFSVEATEITEENIEDIARYVGEVRTKDGEKYIALDRRIIPNVGKAFVGWWFTRLGENLRCYSPKIFNEQFAPMPDGQVVTFDLRVNKKESEDLVEPKSA